MDDKRPYPVQPAPESSYPLQNYLSNMPPPPPPVVQNQPLIVQTGMPSLTTSPQHLGRLKFYLHFKK